jgi:hypothetical protein
MHVIYMIKSTSNIICVSACYMDTGGSEFFHFRSQITFFPGVGCHILSSTKKKKDN